MRAAGFLGLVVALGTGLAACGERPQTASARKADATPYAAAASGSGGFTAGQWSAGDGAAWQRQIVTRMQGQNEYVRTGTFGAQPAAARMSGMSAAPGASAAATVPTAPAGAVAATAAVPASGASR